MSRAAVALVPRVSARAPTSFSESVRAAASDGERPAVEDRLSGADRAVLLVDVDRVAGWLKERGLMLRPKDVPPVAVTGSAVRFDGVFDGVFDEVFDVR